MTINRNKIQPPKIFRKVFEWMLSPYSSSSELGDAEEKFYTICEKSGSRKARWWYRKNVLFSLPHSIKNSLQWSLFMFANYFKLSLRNYRKYPVFSFINVAGLAIAYMAVLLIYLFLDNEMNYDSFFTDSEQIYRIETKQNYPAVTDYLAVSPYLLSNDLNQDFPEVVQATPINKSNTNYFFGHGAKQFNEKDILIVEPEFLQIFDYPFLEGDSNTALSEPNVIILTKETKEKYFPGEDALGKIITYNNDISLTVTGVLGEYPSNVHVQFDMIILIESLFELDPARRTSWHNWGNKPVYTYAKLKKGTDLDAFEKKLSSIVDKNYRPDNVTEFYLQPLEDIYLQSNSKYQLGASSDMKYIITFVFIGVFLMVIACFNFINLTTAGAENRAKEIAVRKTSGAHKAKLIQQFIFDSVVNSCVALLVGLAAASLAAQSINELSIAQIAVNDLFTGKSLMYLGIFAVGFGMLAGLYPALFMTRIHTISALKGITGFSGKLTSRKWLVSMQFAIAGLMIISTLTVKDQIKYMLYKDLGFSPHKVISAPIINQSFQGRFDGLKEIFLNVNGVNNVSYTWNVPGRGITGFGTRLKGTNDPAFSTSFLLADEDFVPTYEIDVIAGENLPDNRVADLSDKILINRTLARRYGFANPQDAIGKEILGYGYGKIVGVIEDYNFSSVHNRVDPLVVKFEEESLSYISFNLDTENISQIVGELQEKWAEVLPDQGFNYFFINEDFNRQYRNDEIFEKLINYFSIIAITIVLLGLYGLILFVTKLRLKEIGIRKVLGSTLLETVKLFSSSFNKLIVFSILLSWPAAYFAMKSWLNNYAYKIDINPQNFLFSLGFIFLITLIPVIIQSLKAVLINPAQILREE